MPRRAEHADGHSHRARVHRRVANVRKAFHWELARDLCTQLDHITLETLNLRDRKPWGRKDSDWVARFVDILHHVASKLGTIVHHIDAWFTSTRLCSARGHTNHHNNLA